ncbi:MAG TPA: BON domain-containing protein [Kiritimatiellia bacterium]|nr:BON domain-containing protein [Kiritimatiellia bacterium]
MKQKNRQAGWRTACAVLVVLGLGAAAGCATLVTDEFPSAESDLRAQVAQRLAMDPLTQQGLYRVEVDGGRVILHGTVSSEAERMRVLGVVRGTPGVSDVTDRLRLIR